MSEVRQRQPKDKSPKRSQPTNSDSQKKSAAAEKSGGPGTCLVFFAILLLSLGSAFLYINHTHGETFAQTADRVQHLATKAIAQLQKTVSDAQKSGGRGLARLEAEYGKAFEFSLENGAFSLTSRRCTIPTAIDEEWKGILQIAQRDFPEITELLFNNYTCNQISNQGLINLGEALTGFKNLKNLRVDVRSAKNISSVGVQQFGALLAKNAPNLESLEFNITLLVDAQVIDDKGLKAFAAGIENLKNLKSLNLNLAGTQITNAGAIELVERIGNSLHKLTKLNLDFKWVHTLNDDFVNKYAQAITQLKNLESIYYNVDGCQEITDKGFTALGEALAQLPKLKEFTMSLYKSVGVNSAGFQALFKGLETQPLERLGLLFIGAPGLNDEANDQLQAIISKHINTLKFLNLNLNGNKNFTPAGAKKLAANFDQTFPQLQEFTLDMGSAETTEAVVLPLLQNLKKSGSTLETLAVKFDRVEGNADQIYIEIGELLQKHFQNLKQFEFHVFFTPKFTETSFSKFVNTLGSLPKLETLDFLLAGLPKTFGEAMKSFANDLQHSFRNLKTLSLTFFQPPFGSDAVVNFAKGLQYQKQLDKFVFKLMGCKNVDNEGAKALVSSITENLQNLTELQLNFDWADKITDEGAKVMSTLIPSKLKKLKKVHLSLSNVGSITDRALMRMATEFAQHDNLQVVFLQVGTSSKRPAALAPKMKALLQSTPAGDVIA